MLKTDIVIVCATGQNLSSYLKRHLLEQGIKSHAVGPYFKNVATKRRIANCKTIIFVHPDIKTMVEEEFDLSEKTVICLKVNEMPGLSGERKNLTGEVWLEHQNNHVKPELEKQIKKYLKKLK